MRNILLPKRKQKKKLDGLCEKVKRHPRFVLDKGQLPNVMDQFTHPSLHSLSLTYSVKPFNAV